MTTRADYPDAVWARLIQAPAIVWLGVATVDQGGGLQAWLQEVKTYQMFSQEARQAYRGNQLIQAVLAEIDPDAHPVDSDHSQYTPEDSLVWLRELDGMLEDTDEVGEFKVFLLALAEHVARAAREDRTGTGELVSRREAAYLLKLKETLGL